MLSARALALLVLALVATPVVALADQSSQPSAPAAGRITASTAHSCAIAPTGLRCWGFGGNGRLGYGSTQTIGDDETPASQPPIVFAGRSPITISAGDGHNCVLLDDATVRCWGFGGNGRLGYANIQSIGDDEPASSAGPVDLGAMAKMVAAGDSHTCAALDDGAVRCWGYGNAGQLGYGNGTFVNGSPQIPFVGDDETPGSVAPVDLGPGAKANVITAGEAHTCVLLEGGVVRCWGEAGQGQLGLGANTNQNIGDNEKPSTVAPVDLGAAATAISAGNAHTCAILDDATVRCWGFGANGQLGYANTSNVGDNETPASAGPVDLGPGHTARAISAGRQHTCAILDDGSVRCWGTGSFGQLGSGTQDIVGDDETPGAAATVDLGAGRSAIAIEAAARHTCALLDDTSVRCWGYGANGRLGLCNETTIGDSESPAAAGPVDLGAGGAGCAVAVAPGDGGAATPPPPPPVPAPLADVAAAAQSSGDPRVAERARAARLRACLRAAARRPRAQRARARRACLARHSTIPSRVTALRARALSRTRIQLTFSASGSDGRKAPAARAYLVRQSQRPLRRPRDLARAIALCRRSCRFVPTAVGTKITLTVTGLRPRTTYYYTVAARDNVSGRLGPRSLTVRVRTP